MTGRASPAPTARREATIAYRQAGWGALRARLSSAVVLAVHYRLPFDRSSTWIAAHHLASHGLVLLIALIAWQVRLIVAHPYPGVRGRSTEVWDVWATLICVRCWRVARRSAGAHPQRLSSALTPGPVPLSGAV